MLALEGCIETHTEMTQDATTILIVEDDPSFTKLITAMLHTGGFSVTAVPSAEAAIGLLTGQSFDAIITDLRMEGMGGIGLIRWIQEDLAAMTGRVLVITGEPASSEDIMWIRGQNIPIVHKPFSVRALLDAVRELQER